MIRKKPRTTEGPLDVFSSYVREVRLKRDEVADFSRYPYSIPAINKLDTLTISPTVTFLVGENGSGKSTLVEAIAIAAGFNAEGGTQNLRFATRRSESSLHEHLRLVRGVQRPRTGFFLRAESFFNVASEIEKDPFILEAYGGTPLHEKSHGEAFLTLVNERFGRDGLYILDEPEAALSPQRQLSLLAAIHSLVNQRSQFIVATHSPIVLAYPGATIYLLSEQGIQPIEYEDTEQYALTRDFLLNRGRYLKELLLPDGGKPS
jgi:predicted ATPase